MRQPTRFGGAVQGRITVKPERNLEAAKPSSANGATNLRPNGLSHGAAVCGPACTVVWEGRSREASPGPDSSYSLKMTYVTVSFRVSSIISKYMAEAREARMDGRVQAALTSIEEIYTENLTVIRLSRDVGLTRSRFGQLFKKETGRAFKDYLAFGNFFWPISAV